MSWKDHVSRRKVSKGCERQFLAKQLGISSYFIPPDNAEVALLREKLAAERVTRDEPQSTLAKDFPKSLWDFHP